MGFTLSAGIPDGLSALGSDTYLFSTSTTYHALTFSLSLVGIAESDLQSYTYGSYESSDPSIATAGDATSGSSCVVIPSKGGTVTITLKRKLTSGEEVSFTKELTFLRPVLKIDSVESDLTVPTAGLGNVSTTPHTLEASLEGASGSIGCSWSTSDSSIISLSATSGSSITATCVNAGFANITMSINYGGTSYPLSKSFVVTDPSP